MRLPSWAYSWREVAVQYAACLLILPLWIALRVFWSGYLRP